MTVCTFDPGDVVALFGEADGRELLRLAAADLRSRLDALDAALAAGDRTGAARAAHAIAGVAGNAVAPTLSDLARELEGALRAAEAVPAFLVERLAHEAQAVLGTITPFLSHSHGARG